MSQPLFTELGLSETILEAIAAKGFTHPSPIQAGVIPLLLSGKRDIIGQAQTGTGKTAAFALPLLELLDSTKKQNQAIILAPTRELAIQVAKEISSFSVKKSPTVAVVYGGNSLNAEFGTLRTKPNIIVGTPGRMQHHIRKGNIDMNTITHFVLDEADEMLSFGFREEIEEMLSLTPENRRVLLFSATMPREILRIAKEHMKEYDTVKIEAKEMTNANIKQKFYCLKPHDKFEALCRIMEMEEHFYAIVFCRTKSDTDLIASQLAAKLLRAEAIHGDIDQNHREKILARFKSGKTNILVATDVAARGIDVAALNFVVNYSLPENHEIYTHRIGRTGRAGNKGTAITFISRNESYRLKSFEKRLNTTIEKGTIPEPKDIIQQKKMHLLEQVEHVVLNEPLESLRPLATQLLEEGDAVDVVAALLKQTYGTSFDIEHYRRIYEETPSQYGGGGGSRGRSGGGRGRSNGGGGGYRGRRSGGGNFTGGGKSSRGGAIGEPRQEGKRSGGGRSSGGRSGGGRSSNNSRGGR